MNALLLPGNSSRHSEWVESLKLSVATHFQCTIAQHYKHWQTGNANADVDYEIGVAQAEAEELDPYLIIAKSIGTVIAAKGTAEGVLKPKKLILLGVPINGGISRDLFFEWLQKIDVEITIVQNANDPFGSFADVKSALERAGGRVTFVELPDHTHDYLKFDSVARLI